MLAKVFLQRQLILFSKIHMKEKASKIFKGFDHDLTITVQFKHQMKEYMTFSKLCWSLNFVHLDLLKYSFK